MATFSVFAHVRSTRSRFGCSTFSRFALDLRRFAARVLGFLDWRAGLIQCSCDQFVTWSSAVDKSKHMIVGVALANCFNAAFVLQAGQFAHHERLFCPAHITIVDIERQTS